MHILTVLDHPNPASFSAAVAQKFMEGAVAAGHSVELADLHAEGFDPRWTLTDIEADESSVVRDDISKEQVRIERSDAVCLVFPLYWWGMPAMTKGWIDRVWSWDWAYNQLDDPELSLLRKRPGVLLVPAGARSDEIEESGYLASLETAWMKGTFGYFGLSPRKLELLCGTGGSAARREALLERSYQIGLEIIAIES